MLIYWLICTFLCSCSLSHWYTHSNAVQHRLMNSIAQCKHSLWKDDYLPLTHWGRVTHICVSKLIIIGSDNGLSPHRRQAIIWTNAGILLIGPLGTNFSENLIGVQTFSLKKMRLKTSSAKWRPFCLGLNVLMSDPLVYPDRIICHHLRTPASLW